MPRRNRNTDEFSNSNYQPSSPAIKKFIIKYLNQKQKEYGRAIQTNDIIYGVGPAGTGKTWIATLHAIQLFNEGCIDRIIITRPIINAGGEDKLEPYVRPVLDVFNTVWLPSKIQTLISYKKIEITPLAYLRGRTFKNCVVIAEEMQNSSEEQMFMLLTRLGENCKIIITGDPKQTDLLGMSSLNTAYRQLSHIKGVAFVYFTEADIVRHPLVSKIIENWHVSDSISLNKRNKEDVNDAVFINSGDLSNGKITEF